MHFTLSLGIELTLMVLLAFTLVYCIVLERRLSALRSGQDGLKATFGELSTALTAAATTVRALKQSAADAAEQLDERLTKARALADELALMTASGERIADRFDRAPAPKMAMPAGAMNHRLEALRAVR
jgi:erythromycin esterase-like protein